jgi:hypothetical protein
LAITSEHFVLDDIANGMIINELLTLLTGVHQRLFTNPVNNPHGSGGTAINLIDRLIGKKFVIATGVGKVTQDIRLAVPLS